jgi:hypothetical protein
MPDASSGASSPLSAASTASFADRRDPDVYRDRAEPAGFERHPPGCYGRLRKPGWSRLQHEPGYEFVQPEVVHAPRDRRRNAVEHQRFQSVPMRGSLGYYQFVHLLSPLVPVMH